MTTKYLPFFVGINNPRFRGVSIDGYLPALEQPVDIQPKVVKPQFLFFKNDIRALRLSSRVTELESSNRYFLKKIKEIEGHGPKQYEPF